MRVIRKGVRVAMERAREERRICPPPSPWEPSMGIMGGLRWLES
jgi:hypothetical protein